MLNNAQSPTTNEHRSINQADKPDKPNNTSSAQLSSAFLSQQHEVINVRSRRRVEEAEIGQSTSLIIMQAAHGYSQSPALSCKPAMPGHAMHPHNHHRREGKSNQKV
jgi:hypothetical protein